MAIMRQRKCMTSYPLDCSLLILFVCHFKYMWLLTSCWLRSKSNKHTLFFPQHTERLALIRQQRAEAAKKREEEKAGNFYVLFLILFSIPTRIFPILISFYAIICAAKEQKKVEARKWSGYGFKLSSTIHERTFTLSLPY